MASDDAGETTQMSVPARREFIRRPATHLLEVTGGAPHLRFPLNAEELILGRGTDSQFRIDSEELSRKHVRFRRRGPEYVVHDLDSRNGVFLNGLRVHSAVLRDGDVLELGNVVILYRDRF